MRLRGSITRLEATGTVVIEWSASDNVALRRAIDEALTDTSWLEECPYEEIPQFLKAVQAVLTQDDQAPFFLDNF